ncbi:hypothetical protein V6N12_024706 [Hibiscus sabdariffa]|uniref:Cysteine-rich transmembrane domain-containing protein n=1 Tax=Hibiscus sabdariffa TaxID=183260 RepID=A0ABR2BH17_9ROSI
MEGKKGNGGGDDGGRGNVTPAAVLRFSMANNKQPQDPTTHDNKSPAFGGSVTRDKGGNGRKRSCLEGCVFALCCCWLWEACFDL